MNLTETELERLNGVKEEAKKHGYVFKQSMNPDRITNPSDNVIYIHYEFESKFNNISDIVDYLKEKLSDKIRERQKEDIIKCVWDTLNF